MAALKKIPAKERPSEATVIEAIRAWKKSATWTKNDGQFVCACDIWVKNRQWENTPEPASPPRKKFSGCQEELDIPDLVAIGRQRRAQQQLQQQS